ncbi:MAG: type I-U CRISPR-associated protein Csb2 [Longimicrobiales bacterium]
MLRLEVRFLTGRYAAGSDTDPSRSEWPPHPARLFSALAEALYQPPTVSDTERASLEWLAAAGPPEVIASACGKRTVTEVYVATNDANPLRDIDKYLLGVLEAEQAAAADGLSEKDRRRRREALAKAESKLFDRASASVTADGAGVSAKAMEAAVEVLSDRVKQPRFFPVAIPHDDSVRFVWKDDPTDDVRSAIDRLASRVSRLGHSSSLVSVRVEPDAADDEGDRLRWVPDPAGSELLRVPQASQVEDLDRVHARHRGVGPRVIPYDDARSWYTLERAEETVPVAAPNLSSQAAEWIVYEVVASDSEDRLRLDISLAQKVARAVRGTVLSHLDPDAPASLTGHDPAGSPASEPHLAFVPLPDVGHQHASGTILGVALIPPTGLPVRERDRLVEALFHAESAGLESGAPGKGLRLTLGRHGVMYLSRPRGAVTRRTLVAERWTAPSRRWTTVTPIALGRNPGNLMSRDVDTAADARARAEATVAEACSHLGLPRPRAVIVHRRSLPDGAPAAKRFMPYPDNGGGPRRVCVHAEVVFDNPVRGPVILGAGRFFGLGLCLPWREPVTGPAQ